MNQYNDIDWRAPISDMTSQPNCEQFPRSINGVFSDANFWPNNDESCIISNGQSSGSDWFTYGRPSVNPRHENLPGSFHDFRQENSNAFSITGSGLDSCTHMDHTAMIANSCINNSQDRVTENFLQRSAFPLNRGDHQYYSNENRRYFTEPENTAHVSMYSGANDYVCAPSKRPQQSETCTNHDGLETKRQCLETFTRIPPTPFQNSEQRLEISSFDASDPRFFFHDVDMREQSPDRSADMDWRSLNISDATGNLTVSPICNPADAFSNTYLAHHDIDERRPFTKLRPIIIDGTNIAMSHGEAIGTKMLSVAGLLRCLEYFVNRGHEVTVFIPGYQRRAFDAGVIADLEKKCQIAYTPRPEISGEFVHDKEILKYATLMGGIVVSNKMFNYLHDELEGCQNTIDTTVLRFSWESKDCLRFWPITIANTSIDLEQFLRFV